MQTTLNKVKERATEHFMNELKGLDSIDLQRGISLYNSIKSDLVNFINRIGRADSENLEFTFNCLYTVDEVLSLSQWLLTQVDVISQIEVNEKYK